LQQDKLADQIRSERLSLVTLNSHEDDYRGANHSITVGVGTSKAVAELRDAWSRADHLLIGELLGYPKCCQTWYSMHIRDIDAFEPIWSMAERYVPACSAANDIEIVGASETNMLLRGIGLRRVFHLPCSTDCDASHALAASFSRLAESLGYLLETGWLEDVLSWPSEWSSVNGIAEIKTPLFKICSWSGLKNGKYRVRLRGSRYPNEAPAGLAFPFRTSSESSGLSSSFARGLATISPLLQIVPDALTEAKGPKHSAIESSQFETPIPPR
jgi:hypothetical protein